ncbi:hypothetical protein ACFSQ3_09740 [Sphingobacterium corticis]|uniref:Phage integrase SAM-like domain-containing protein n=1 Tax=Sphingobacterium corticis TaxID=1812823 RepID=A0ABW5NMG6_9SPHI
MKPNKRIGRILELVKEEYYVEYRQSTGADHVADYLHVLCTQYGQLVGKNVSVQKPIEFACQQFRIYLQEARNSELNAEEVGLKSVFSKFNGLILQELLNSKIRFKEAKISVWQNCSEELLQQHLPALAV